MAGTTTRASRNGHEGDDRIRGRIDGDTRDASEERSGGGGILGFTEKAVRLIGSQVARRIPTADLDDRDPDYIRERLPGMWLLASLYFRGEVRGLGNVPEEGPVLLVGNHSGGNLTVDSGVFTLAFSA
jgi:hypothetical protein